jgi:hypothetical protein
MSERWSLHRKRVCFGKEPLELWMFVPCKFVKGDYIPLEEPNLYEERLRSTRDGGWWGEFLEYKKQYEEAKKKCLFEGFTFEYDSVVKYENYIFSIRGKTIENLIRIYCYPKLTTTAKEQLGFL